MPSSHIETIGLTIEIYNLWIGGSNLPSLVAENMQMYIQLFIESIFSVFEMVVDSEFAESKTMKNDYPARNFIFGSALQFYRNIMYQKLHRLSEKTWYEFFIFSTCNLYLDFLGKNFWLRYLMSRM